MSSKSESVEADPISRPSGRGGLLERLRAALGLAPTSVREELEDALDDAEADVTAQERTLLKNVLGLHELRVADAMIPRAEIIAAPRTSTLREILALFRSAGHSRLPIYGETLDDPIGMLHIRDFVNYLAESAERSRGDGKDLSVAAIDFSSTLEGVDILRPVLFVPRSMPALDLLVRMQATRTHMALVIDEYGGTDGLVSIEDIVEMIVGDIEDEHDVHEGPLVERLPNGDFLIDAKADLAESIQDIGVDFRDDDTPQEATTFGGLVAYLAGHVPPRGEIVQASVPGYEFEILESDPRRVAKLRLRLRPPQEGPPETEKS
jgi:CBS domain containing-hemolysin-like protein